MRKYMMRFLAMLLCGVISISAVQVPVLAAENEGGGEPDYYAEAEERKNEEVQSDKIEGWPEGPKIGAEGAILMEADSGTILYAKNIHEHLYPASITKVLTGLLAYEKLKMNDKVDFSETAVYSIEFGSSSIGIDPGEQLTVEQSLYALFVASANEVAAGLAEKMGGSLDKFADMMNARAKKLGCQDSHFVNAHGLFNEEHYTSAYDMALISREFFSHDELCTIANSPTYFMESSEKQPEEFTLFNKHKLINGEIEYEGIVGGKTGYVEMSRQTLVTCAERDGMKLICVILREESPNQFYDTIELFDYGFNNFSKLKISDYEKQYTINNPGFMRLGKDIYGSNSIPFTISGKGYVCIPKEVSFDSLTSEVVSDDKKAEEVVKESSASGSTETDEKKVIGKIQYKVGDWSVGQTDILFTGTIPGANTEIAAEGATAGMTSEIAAEQEPETYGTAHYSENKSFLDGIKYFFKGIFHSGSNGTVFLDVPALLFLIIIVSSILIVVIFIFSYIAYLNRRRRRARRRRKKKQK